MLCVGCAWVCAVCAAPSSYVKGSYFIIFFRDVEFWVVCANSYAEVLTVLHGVVLTCVILSQHQSLSLLACYA